MKETNRTEVEAVYQYFQIVRHVYIPLNLYALNPKTKMYSIVFQLPLPNPLKPDFVKFVDMYISHWTFSINRTKSKSSIEAIPGFLKFWDMYICH